MTTPSVRPPAPEGELIASWIDGWMRLEHLDGGAVIVVIVRRDERLHVGDVTYGDSLTDTEVHWNITGAMEIEQYKRDFWNSKIYPVIARWRGGRR